MLIGERRRVYFQGTGLTRTDLSESRSGQLSSAGHSDTIP